MKITHCGNTFETVHYDSDLSDTECETIRKEFFELPSMDEVITQLNSIHGGGMVTNKVINYFIKPLMYDSKSSSMKWTINEFMESNDLIRFVMGKIKNNPNFFKEANISSVRDVFRMSPSGTAQQIPNFPFKTAKSIIKKYNVNGNYYDYSCGWGIRLLASLSNDINYFGTDPNEKLTKKLIDLHKAYKLSNYFADSTVDIQSQGSEIFIPNWKNKMGLAFSSPPYFDLELYSLSDDTNQSIKNRNYEAWLDEYWSKTVGNIYSYLIQDGYFLLNVKNIKKYSLLTDMEKITKSWGFKFVCYENLKNSERPIFKKSNKTTDELIAVYMK